jgi:BlaI family penicillinase repressor
VATSPSDVTEMELAILEVLWDQGPASVRQVAERVYPGRGPSAHPTVQKLLARLEAKKYVSRDKSGEAHRFAAAVDRGKLISARLRALAEGLCGGSMSSLLTHLVRTESLNPADRQALHKLFEDWKTRESSGEGREA